MISGLKMASKVFTIIYGAKLGKPVAPPYPGSSSAKSNAGAEGKGLGKKLKSVRNKLNRGTSST